MRVSTDQSVQDSSRFEPLADETERLLSARLSRSGYQFLAQVACEYSAGVVVLSGTIPTFYLKQMAQELASHTPGVRQVRNCLRVTG